MTNKSLADRVAIVGVGVAPDRLTRSAEQSLPQYTIDACLRAAEDAGLDIRSIDGLSTVDDPHSVRPFELASHLGLSLGFWGSGGAVSVGNLITAAHAVAAGLCDYALVYRAMTARFGATPSLRTTGRIGGSGQWHYPYGIHNDIYYTAFHMTRYMHRYAVSEEDIGHVALTQRKHASLNPFAVFRDTPLSMDDYLASRYITWPMHLFDADMPVDGAVAAILTTRERAQDLRQRPVYLHAWAHATGPGSALEQWPEWSEAVSKYCSERLWATTTLRPRDMDFANLYDGYSIIFLQWLEEAGFCGPGEGPAFVREGNTAIGGKVPMNTSGGALSEGRTHGMGHIVEAVHQLRGDAGERQRPNAELGMVSNAGLNLMGSVVILRR